MFSKVDVVDTENNVGAPLCRGRLPGPKFELAPNHIPISESNLIANEDPSVSL